MEVNIQKRRISLVTTMGIPACGKTSLCQELIKFASEKDPPKSAKSPSVLFLQYDAIVPLQVQSQFAKHPNLAKTFRINFLRMLTHLVQILQAGKPLSELTQLDDSELSSENDEIRPKSAFISAFVSQVTTYDISQSSLDDDIILLIDDNNYYKSMRNDFYQIAKSNSLGFCILYPTAPTKVCQERNLSRNEATRIPSTVIDDMSRKLEEPNPMQNPADSLCLQVSDVFDPDSHHLIYDTLLYTLQNPVCPTHSSSKVSPDEIEKERRICAENEIHQADLILRKWIHKALALASFGTTREELKKKGQEYQQRKEIVLAGLRSSQIQITSSPGDEYEFHKEILRLARSVKLDH